MRVELPLSEMTLPEKLQLTEILWDDLTRKPSEFESPAWHKDVLEDCRRRSATGEEKFTDWEAAKEEVRRTLRKT